MKLSFVYATPVSVLRELMTAEDLAIAWAAERQGLIPDPWLQTATICETLVNINRAKDAKRASWSDFIYRWESSVKPQTAESLDAGFKQRKALAKNGRNR